MATTLVCHAFLSVFLLLLPLSLSFALPFLELCRLFTAFPNAHLIVIDTYVLDSEKLDYLEQKLSHTIKFREGGWCVLLLVNKKNSFCDEFLKDFANWYSKQTRGSQFFSLPMVFDFEYGNFFICFPNYYVHINLIKEVFSNILVEYNGEIDEIVSKGVELKGKRR